MSQVVLERVSKSFAAPGRDVVQALRTVSFTAQTGELTALLGPSGCGKTTLLRVIAGLERPDSGGLSIDGKDVLPLPAKDRGVAMVFQQPALYPHLTARENLAFGLRLRKVPPREIQQRIGETASLLEISECLDRLPQHLSGGQRQRVALGRAMVRRPGVYLLDEPLSQLDTPMRLQLRQDLRRIQQELGATVILVTHDQSDAFAIADRVAVMIGGAILQCDRPREIYDTPARVEVAGFIGNPPMNLLPIILAAHEEASVRFGSDSGGKLQLMLPNAHLLPELKSHIGKEILLGIRPEHVTIASNSVPDDSAITARITSLEYSGADLVVQLTADSMKLAARVPAEINFAPGQEVRVALPFPKCLCYDPVSGSLIPWHDKSGVVSR